MRVIEARNVNDAFTQGVGAVLREGIARPSRNGPMIEYPGPVATHYRRPTERVLWAGFRDANPYFHFFESLWMLAGREDAAFPAFFAKQIAKYADGDTLHGAYGYRWREHWCDQLDNVVRNLRKDPYCRRQVVAMWDPEIDAAGDKLDHPCNTHIYFSVRDAKLNMTVCNRSNDVVWGAYGANAVHMSFLQEYMAARIQVAVGSYWQVSNSFHIYPEVPAVKRVMAAFERGEAALDHYTSTPRVCPLPLDPATFDEDLLDFFDGWDDAGGNIRLGPAEDHRPSWFTRVVYPMFRSWVRWKQGDRNGARAELQSCVAEDWRLACEQWLDRRKENDRGYPLRDDDPVPYDLVTRTSDDGGA